MKQKRSPKELLRSFSWLYIIYVVLGVALAVVIATVPVVRDAIVSVKGNEEGNPVIIAETILIIQILIALWYFWLVRRFCDGKSRGTVYMVLLILSVASGIVSIIFPGNQGTTSFNTTKLAIDALALFWLVKARKSE